jgi:23S rRNA-intervening sequence protein
LSKDNSVEEIPIIQKTYDFIKWYVPILNKLPKNHKFLLGDRMVSGLYDFLEQLIKARFERDKLARLENLNSQLAILRYQTRLLLDFQQIEVRRFEYISKQLNGIGTELGGWIKQQQDKQPVTPNETLRKPVVVHR